MKFVANSEVEFDSCIHQIFLFTYSLIDNVQSTIFLVIKISYEFQMCTVQHFTKWMRYIYGWALIVSQAW